MKADLLEDEYICIKKDEYIRLIDTETRVDVLIDLVAAKGPIITEDMLRILGTEQAISLADDIKRKDEEKIEAYRNAHRELHEV